MKIKKDSLRQARQLFKLSFKDGKIDEGIAKKIITKLLKDKPKDYLGILSGYHRMLRLELEKRTAIVQTAEALSASEEIQVKQDLQRRYGDDLKVEFKTNPELLGGMRVQVGNDVLDGSVQARLEALRNLYA